MAKEIMFKILRYRSDDYQVIYFTFSFLKLLIYSKQKDREFYEKYLNIN